MVNALAQILYKHLVGFILVTRGNLQYGNGFLSSFHSFFLCLLAYSLLRGRIKFQNKVLPSCTRRYFSYSTMTGIPIVAELRHPSLKTSRPKEIYAFKISYKSVPAEGRRTQQKEAGEHPTRAEPAAALSGSSPAPCSRANESFRRISRAWRRQCASDNCRCR
jgi:hypothetical protein